MNPDREDEALEGEAGQPVCVGGATSRVMWIWTYYALAFYVLGYSLLPACDLLLFLLQL